MTLLEAIAATESADRGLDAEIAVYVAQWLGHVCRMPIDGEQVAPGNWWDKIGHAEFLRAAPTYTLNAGIALTLVPAGVAALDHLCEHWCVEAGHLVKAGGATCKIVRAGANGLPEKFQAEGATLPLAICATAIKLLEATK